jgi:hypothetical protein
VDRGGDLDSICRFGLDRPDHRLCLNAILDVFRVLWPGTGQ